MEALGTLAGGIAHDFNNLLMGIQGRASLMAMDLAPDHALYEHVRAIDPTLRVLLSSGYALDGQAEAVLEKGCSGFIQKPFTLQELSNKIRSILD